MININKIRTNAEPMEKYRDEYIDSMLRSVPYRLARIKEIDGMIAEHLSGITIPGYEAPVDDDLEAERAEHVSALMKIETALDKLPHSEQDLVESYYFTRLSADFLARLASREKKYILRKLQKIRSRLEL